MMTGGDAIVTSLVAHGVDTVFSLPGGQIYGLTDALARTPSIRTIGARHEQAAAYMAFGYARSLNRPGVFAVVPGPGILNAAAGLLTAHSTNTPVLALTGDVPSGWRGRGRGALHELPEQLGVLRAVAKWAEHIDRPAQAPGLVAAAFQAMRSGRQGAAALQAPWDFFTESAEVHPARPLAPVSRPAPDTDAIDRAAKLLASARAPMLFVGSGALDAAMEVRQLAETLGAPVVSFRGGRGIVPDDHKLGLTVAAGQMLWPHTDVAVVIGSRFELLDIRWRHRPRGLKLIRIDIDPVEACRLDADVSIVADAAAGADALAAALQRASGPAHRDSEIADAKAAAEKRIHDIQPQVDYLRAIRDVLPRDGFFVDELSQVGFASIFGFPVYRPRSLISAGYQGTLGFGFPTALGVKVGSPNKAVVSVTGDGGFMFAVQELATAVQYGIGLVTVLFNNAAYGNVRRDQQRLFEGRLLGSDLVNPDFVALARSFGVEAERADTPDALRPALERAFAAGGPRLIEVRGRQDEADPWPILHPHFPPPVGQD